MSTQKVPAQTVHRSSVDGQFVTKRYADQHPRITEAERIKHPK